MLDSVTKSTLKQYESSFKAWWSFTKEKNYNIYITDDVKIIEFLTMRFSMGYKYGTLNSDRAAIALITQQDNSSEKLITRFMRGIFKKRPTKAKYTTTWNVDSVLQYVESIPDTENLNLKDLSQKTVTLMILATAQRLQTMTLITTDNIVISESAINIKVPELIKTSKPGGYQPDLTLPFFGEKQNMCVARSLIQYLKLTKELRGNCKTLFISTIKPHKAIGAQTLGHWVKSFLKKAGVDINQFSAYSVKHAAVSKANARGVDIDTIRRTAGWSKQSSVFAKFYNRPIQDPNDTFARSVLLT